MKQSKQINSWVRKYRTKSVHLPSGIFLQAKIRTEQCDPADPCSVSVFCIVWRSWRWRILTRKRWRHSRRKSPCIQETTWKRIFRTESTGDCRSAGSACSVNKNLRWFPGRCKELKCRVFYQDAVCKKPEPVTHCVSYSIRASIIRHSRKLAALRLRQSLGGGN